MLFRGPEDSPFDGGVFAAELVFPQDYPLNPPKMKFISEIFHPNGKPILPYSGYISSGKKFVLSSHFVHVALRERLFCLESIRSTRNENEKNEMRLCRNIPSIR